MLYKFMRTRWILAHPWLFYQQSVSVEATPLAFCLLSFGFRLLVFAFCLLFYAMPPNFRKLREGTLYSASIFGYWATIQGSLPQFPEVRGGLVAEAMTMAMARLSSIGMFFKLSLKQQLTIIRCFRFALPPTFAGSISGILGMHRRWRWRWLDWKCEIWQLYCDMRYYSRFGHFQN